MRSRSYRRMLDPRLQMSGMTAGAQFFIYQSLPPLRPSDPSRCSGQAKEGKRRDEIAQLQLQNKKTLDPFLDWIPD